MKTIPRVRFVKRRLALRFTTLEMPQLPMEVSVKGAKELPSTLRFHLADGPALRTRFEHWLEDEPIVKVMAAVIMFYELRSL